MRSPRGRRFGGFVFAVALFPCSARAQTPAQSFEELQRLLNVRQKVVVTDETRQQVTGRIEKLSAGSITVDGRIFTDAAIREIRLPDGLWNGMLVGAAIGTGLATWDYLIDPSEPDNALIFTVAVGVGTAIGAGIDALRTRGGRLVYASPRARPTVRVLPMLERNRQGAVVCVRF